MPATNPAMWSNNWPHEAPEEPFTITGALMAIHAHGHCSDTCGRKAAAERVLNAAHLTHSMGLR